MENSKEKQINKMTLIINKTGDDRLAANRLFNAGYGDVKQAVEEFAGKLKVYCEGRKKKFEELSEVSANNKEYSLSLSFLERVSECLFLEIEIEKLLVGLYGVETKANK